MKRKSSRQGELEATIELAVANAISDVLFRTYMEQNGAIAEAETKLKNVRRKSRAKRGAK